MLTENNERAIQRAQMLMGGELDETKLGFLRMWDDNLMVVSCAGSGKTKLCKGLILSRILSQEVKPKEVLYMSFSKDCIKDTKDQVIYMLYEAGVTGDCVIRTVHSVFYGLLQKLGALNRSKDVLSVSDEQKLMGDAQRMLGFYDLNADELLKLYECECEGLETSEHLLQRVFNNSAQGERAIAVLEAYKEKKRGCLGLSEFGLLLLYLCSDKVDSQAEYLGRSLGFLDRYGNKTISPEVRAGYLSVVKQVLHKYKLIVIDEVQDLNVAQHQFLELVFGVDAGLPSDRKLVFVGDDDQCIYEWRFSNVDLMRQAPLRYGLRTVYMTKSYRCGDAIMKLGERILSGCADTGRWEKPLCGSGDPGEVKEISTRCRTLQERMKAFGQILCVYEFSDEVGKETARVLMRYRSSAIPFLLHLYDFENAMSGVAEEKFHSVYALEGDFRAEKYVRDLRIMCDAIMQNDKSKTEKCLTLMCRYLSKDSRRRIADCMEELDVGLLELPFLLKGRAAPAPIGKERGESELRAVIASMKFAAQGLYEKTMDSLTQLADTAQDLESRGKQLNDFYIGRYVAKACISNDADAVMVPAIASAQERSTLIADWLVGKLHDMDTAPVSSDGKNGLRRIMSVLSRVEERYTSAAVSSVGAKKIQVGTVHSAKGLQWDTVFFIDANVEGKNYKGNEEVRINYVGVTRARNRLIV